MNNSEDKLSGTQFTKDKIMDAARKTFDLLDVEEEAAYVKWLGIFWSFKRINAYKRRQREFLAIIDKYNHIKVTDTLAGDYDKTIWLSSYEMNHLGLV